MTRRVLITGARAPAALDLARCFRAAGAEVHMADCAPSRMASFSRAVAQVHRYPSPRADFTRFAEAARELIAHLNPVLVIPTCEEVFYFAAIGDDRVFAPNSATLRRVHSKHLFAVDVAALGLPVPATRLQRSATALEPLLADASTLVFKPEYSRFGTQTYIRPSREVAASLRPSVEAPWVAQQFVRGFEVSLYAASVAARLVAFSAYRSAWKFEGGAGYAFEVLDRALHDRLLTIAETLAQKLIPRGQFACDVIVDADGTPWLLECNPRATSGVHLFERGAALAEAMLGERSAPAFAATAPPKHIGPALWAYGLPDALKHRRLSEWSARRKASADVISAPGDPAPVAGALIDTARLSAIALARGISLTAASTADIEWNGEAL
jgi:hypothetical protein